MKWDIIHKYALSFDQKSTNSKAHQEFNHFKKAMESYHKVGIL